MNPVVSPDRSSAKAGITWKEIVLALASVALLCGAGEIATRTLLWAPLRLSTRRPQNTRDIRHVADPELGWINSPAETQANHRITGKDGKVIFDVLYSLKDGHRITAGREIAGPEVIATGCSFTFGYGVRDEESWPWILQQNLPDYRVVNFGTSGYGTDQALMAAEREVVRARGTVSTVILGFADFHIQRDQTSQFVVYNAYPFSKPLFLKDGRGVRYAGQVRFWYPGAFLDHSALAMHAINRVADLLNRIPSHEEAREITIRLILEFAARFRSHGVAFAVVMLPHDGDDAVQSSADQKAVISRLRAAGTPVLVPDFPRTPRGRLQNDQVLIAPPRENHPNARYHAILAPQVRNFLEREHLLIKKKASRISEKPPVRLLSPFRWGGGSGRTRLRSYCTARFLTLLR